MTAASPPHRLHLRAIPQNVHMRRTAFFEILFLPPKGGGVAKGLNNETEMKNKGAAEQ
jgi:hypothetical protein